MMKNRHTHFPGRRLSLLLICAIQGTTLSSAVAAESDRDEPYPAMLPAAPAGSAHPAAARALADLGVFSIAAAGLWGAALTMESDRSGKGNTPHALDLTAARWSNLTAVGGPGLLGATALLLDGSRLNWKAESWNSVVVAAESIELAMGLNQILKRTAGRCRPVAWRRDANGNRHCDPDAVPSALDPDPDAAYLSWPSGHVTGIAAATGAYLGLSAKASYYGTPVWQYWLASGIGGVLTLTTMWLRVRAGAHSWDDTLGAASIGISLGAAVALIHPLAGGPARETSEPASLRLDAAQNGITVSGSF